MADIYSPAPFFVDPWTTTWLPHHYPLHPHHHFAHTRHALSHAFNRIGGELTQYGHPAGGHALQCPPIDVRESEAKFWIDVDLPGLKSRTVARGVGDGKDGLEGQGEEEGMTLKWISARTLLLRAVIRRAPTGEEKVDKEEQEKEKAEHAGETGPFMTVHERKVGVFGRAFNFPVDVEHEAGTVARLENGVLRIEVRKKKVEATVERKVDVQVGGEYEGIVMH